MEEPATAPATLSQSRRFQLDERYAAIRRPFLLVAAFRLSGELDVAKLGRAVRELGRRHDALRMSFLVDSVGEVKVVVSNESQVFVTEIAATGEDEDSIILRARNRWFDRSSAPLARFELHELTGDTKLFLVSLDHLIADGQSLSILMGSLSELYNSSEMNAYGYWRRQTDKSFIQVIKDQSCLDVSGLVLRERERLGSDWMTISVPLEGVTPLNRDGLGRGTVLEHTLSSEQYRRLSELSRHRQATVSMLLHQSVFGFAAARTSKRPFTLISVISGRRRSSERTVGWLSNSLFIPFHHPTAEYEASFAAGRIAYILALASARVDSSLIRRDVWPGSYLLRTDFPALVVSCSAPRERSLALKGVRTELIPLKKDPPAGPGLTITFLDDSEDEKLVISAGFEAAFYDSRAAAALFPELISSIERGLTNFV